MERGKENEENKKGREGRFGDDERKRGSLDVSTFGSSRFDGEGEIKDSPLVLNGT
jgi:hypothetical protein